MSYTPMSDLGQQGLFDITRTLLQQPDLPSLSEALSQLVKRSALADCAAIVLWQAQTQRARYFATRENGNPIDYEDETVLAHGPVRRILSRPDALHCNYHEFSETGHSWPLADCILNLVTTACYRWQQMGESLAVANLSVTKTNRGVKKSTTGCRPSPK